MRAIVFNQVELTGLRSRKDLSVSMSLVTGELNDEHRAILFKMHGKNVKVLMESIDDPDNEAPAEVKSEKTVKSPTQRLYDVMFVWWKQLDSPGEFEDFRKAQMEKFITHVKSKLDPM